MFLKFLTITIFAILLYGCSAKPSYSAYDLARAEAYSDSLDELNSMIDTTYNTNDFKALTIKQVQEILAKKPKLDTSLIGKVAGLTPYELTDGSVLLITSGDIGVWYSRKGITEMIEKIKNLKTGESHHILEGRFTYDDSFPAKTSELIFNLAQTLQLEQKILDNSVESIDKLDAAILKYCENGGEYDSLFAGIVAYVGEVFIKQKVGKWKLKKVGKVWEPYVIGKSGFAFNIFNPVYKRWYDDDYLPYRNELILQPLVLGELEQRMLKH